MYGVVVDPFYVVLVVLVVFHLSHDIEPDFIQNVRIHMNLVVSSSFIIHII